VLREGEVTNEPLDGMNADGAIDDAAVAGVLRSFARERQNAISCNWSAAAMLEMAVSERETLGGLTQFE
jgi:hypothetical protein